MAEPEGAALRVLRRAVAELPGTTRTGQEQMCSAVSQALTGGEVHLAQAGTGTGKSLAYLSAAMTAAMETEERAVISTATLALQRQVIGADAPLVADAVEAETGTRPRVALLKGWHNYVCLHKVGGGYPDEDEPTLFPTDAGSARAPEGPRGGLGQQVLRVRAWAEETESGDRDDLVPGVSDRAWRQVSVTKLECLGSRCPVRDECFAERARNLAHAADVVVTNHAMLGVAAAGSPGALPEHGLLVIDEAHDLVPRVTSAASVELSAQTVDRVGRGVARHAKSALEKLQQSASSLRLALDPLPAGRLVAVPPGLADAALVVGAAARAATSEMGGVGSDDDAGARAVVKSELVVLAEICERLVSDTVAARRDVAWIDRGREGSDPPRLHLAPLEVAKPIAEHLVGDRAVVATSATLQLGGGFEAAARTLGLGGEGGREWSGADYGSPFDYRHQGILYVAARLPRPGREGVAQEALEELADLVAAAGGGTLGLFSSLRGAQRAAEFVSGRVSTPVLCQGEDQLPELVRAFAADPATSLFGTLSLWQGVDVPGETCRLVTIDRIPFPRPDDPIMSARTEVAEARGRNGFMEVSVAHAALLLAQGAGRLIRRSTDRGVVAILDPRVATSGYGRFLMKSLPELWPTRDAQQVRTSLAALAAGVGGPARS
ncbi:MAG: ATP-dependent DNA helicase [bacterium]|nr:ATP-dependent DNA helicase [bacterium]